MALERVSQAMRGNCLDGYAVNWQIEKFCAVESMWFHALVKEFSYCYGYGDTVYNSHRWPRVDCNLSPADGGYGIGVSTTFVVSFCVGGAAIWCISSGVATAMTTTSATAPWNCMTTRTALATGIAFHLFM
jgi:hypothetical protein